MSYQAGDTYPATVTVRDVAGALTDPDTLALNVRDPTGTVLTYDLEDSIIVRDSEGEYHADVPLDAAGMWIISWQTTDEEQVEGVQIAVSAVPTAGITFATLAELALRLGSLTTDDLTAAQRAQGQMLLELVTGTIVDNIGRDDVWASTLHPIPRVVRSVTLEAVARVMQPGMNNPSGVSSESETLGAYSHTVRYGENSGGSTAAAVALGITAAEMALCRKALLGVSSGSAYVSSLATELATGTRELPASESADDLYHWTG